MTYISTDNFALSKEKAQLIMTDKIKYKNDIETLFDLLYVKKTLKIDILDETQRNLISFVLQSHFEYKKDHNSINHFYDDNDEETIGYVDYVKTEINYIKKKLNMSIV